jgi:hypothetical protein
MISKEKINRNTETFKYLMKSQQGLKDYIKNVDIDLSYYGRDRENQKVDQFMIEVDFLVLNDFDPDTDQIFRIVKEATKNLFDFYSNYSFDENLNIVSQKQHPDIDFKKNIFGELLPNLKFSYGDGELSFSLHYMIETVDLKGTKND